MTPAPDLIAAHADSAWAAHAGSLTYGVLALITVTAIIAGVTCWRARAAWRGARDFRLPRRGTSALLLSAILVVLLVLVSTSQQRIPSLTIVSHASTGRSAPTSVHPSVAVQRMSALERSVLPRLEAAFGAQGSRALERRRCSSSVSSVMRARWRPTP